MEHETVGINIDDLAICRILLNREAWLVEVVFAYRVCWHCTSQWCRIHDWLPGPLGPWRSSPLQSPSHMSHPVNAHKQKQIPQCLRQVFISSLHFWLLTLQSSHQNTKFRFPKKIQRQLERVWTMSLTSPDRYLSAQMIEKGFDCNWLFPPPLTCLTTAL